MSFDTIAAIATPSGRGGIGIVRLSGTNAMQIAQTLTRCQLQARYAKFCHFYDAEQQLIDEGLAIYFVSPHSFTGEDVVELQGHGGPVVMDSLLQRCLQLGARMAKPGEFSERAFLNDKIDLAQAEAIADLIDAKSQQAARSAIHSLQGEFSQQITSLVKQLIGLRTYVEAAIDFPEEEIDFLSDGKVAEQLQFIIQQLETLRQTAKQGIILREGMHIAIVGKPNAGKSSLLNCLSGRDSAIVTDIAGTTRDVLREHIQIDGMPLHIIDTAGLRDSDDVIEQEGIKRAWQAVEQADAVLLVNDMQQQDHHLLPQLQALKKPLLIIENKIDQCQQSAQRQDNTIYLSAKTGDGIALLKQALKDVIGYQTQGDDQFIARRRHVDALHRAYDIIITGEQQLQQHAAGELLAEDLYQAQNILSTITGEFTNDDLLGEIFSSFCIGK